MILAAIAKLLLYGGVTLVAGELTVRPRGTPATTPRFAECVRSTTRAGWIALCVGVVVVLLAQARELELEASSESLGVLLGTRWGHGWVLLALSVLLGAVTFAIKRGVLARSLLVVCVSAGLGGLGHAAADVAWPVSSRLLDALHVLCVGGWIGGLFLLSRLDATDTPEGAWAAFSRRSSILAPLVVFSGVLTSLLRLRDGTFSTVLAGDYGRLLLLKVAFALVALAMGALHRRRILQGAVPRRASMRFELAVAALVFMVTSVLTGTAPPGE